MKENIKKYWRLYLTLIVTVSLFSIKIGGQIRWYQFCQEFSLFGAVTKLDKPLIAGVDQIVRGEEAKKVLLEIANNTPVIAENQEFLVIRIKVKNPSKKQFPPLPLQLQLFEKLGNHIDQTLPQVNSDLKENHDLTFQSAYKKFNIDSTFEPGETKLGTYIFVAEKGSILKRYTISWQKGNIQEKSATATLSKKQLQLFNYEDHFALFLFLFLVMTNFISYFQRKRKKRIGFIDYMPLSSILPLFYLAGLPYIVMKDVRIPNLYLKLFLFSFIPTILFYLYKKHQYLITFNFITPEDNLYIQEEFVKRMGWPNVQIEQEEDHVEITNKVTWETYHFYDYFVKTENAKYSRDEARDVLDEIYYSLPINRNVFYTHVLELFIILACMLLFY